MFQIIPCTSLTYPESFMKIRSRVFFRNVANKQTGQQVMMAQYMLKQNQQIW